MRTATGRALGSAAVIALLASSAVMGTAQTAGAYPPGQQSKQGTTQGYDPGYVRMTCAEGSFVEAVTAGRGTIASKPYIEVFGTHVLLSHHHVHGSVAWGHIGSRLATGIDVYVMNWPKLSTARRTFTAKITCTSDKGAAWVIFG